MNLMTYLIYAQKMSAPELQHHHKSVAMNQARIQQFQTGRRTYVFVPEQYLPEEANSNLEVRDLASDHVLRNEENLSKQEIMPINAHGVHCK
jgi:hypothetical protein